MKKFLKKHRGFSILMALGIIAILMIVVTGLANIYIKEFKLSRLSYDEIIAKSSAEGAFEYAMLKIRNHADGFEDSMTTEDIDGKNFLLNSPRNQDLKVEYKITANSTNQKFEIEPNEMIVIPLFVGDGEILSNKSKNPKKSENYNITEGLEVITNDNIIWSISSTNNDTQNYLNQNIILQGSGAIKKESKGKIQINAVDCYKKISKTETKEIDCKSISDSDINDGVAEKIYYSFEEEVNVSDFINGEIEIKGDNYSIKNPYIMIYNNKNKKNNVEIKSSKPFTLPKKHINAIATKGNASQVFSFNEDNTQYYQSLLNTYFQTQK